MRDSPGTYGRGGGGFGVTQIASTPFAGTLLWPVKFPLGGHNGNGALTAIFDAIRDLSAGGRVETVLWKAQRCLEHLLHHDQLTGVPNRLFLSAYLPGMLQCAASRRQALALVFLNLDRFKHVNESWGHAAGDRLLQAVAQRIRATVCPDGPGRPHGKRRIRRCASSGQPERIETATRRLLEALADPFDIDGRPLAISASAGVSLYPRDGATVCELLVTPARRCRMPRRAAPTVCRSTVRSWTGAASSKRASRRACAGRSRTGISKSIINPSWLSSRAGSWRSRRCCVGTIPGTGFVSPESFIGLAEETGLIVPLGEFVLDRVLQDIVRWCDNGGAVVPVAINVSAVQLRCSDFPERLLEAARSAGVSPTLLQVELTESAAFERPEGCDGELIEDPVARLRELGVHIAIDDFGTRYSSLSYLKRWRVDSLKIDRAFVRDLATDPSDLAIVSAVCELARRPQNSCRCRRRGKRATVGDAARSGLPAGAGLSVLEAGSCRGLPGLPVRWSAGVCRHAAGPMPGGVAGGSEAA